MPENLKPKSAEMWLLPKSKSWEVAGQSADKPVMNVLLSGIQVTDAVLKHVKVLTKL